MDTETAEVTPILKVAWTRIAELDAIASRRSKGHLSLRRWIAILGVLATLFAILTQLLDVTGFKQRYPLFSVAAQIFFIAIPFLASTLAALASKKYSNGDWLVTRAETLRRPEVAAVVDAIRERMHEQREVLLGVR